VRAHGERGGAAGTGRDDTRTADARQHRAGDRHFAGSAHLRGRRSPSPESAAEAAGSRRPTRTGPGNVAARLVVIRCSFFSTNPPAPAVLLRPLRVTRTVPSVMRVLFSISATYRHRSCSQPHVAFPALFFRSELRCWSVRGRRNVMDPDKGRGRGRAPVRRGREGSRAEAGRPIPALARRGYGSPWSPAAERAAAVPAGSSVGAVEAQGPAVNRRSRSGTPIPQPRGPEPSGQGDDPMDDDRRPFTEGVGNHAGKEVPAHPAADRTEPHHGAAPRFQVRNEESKAKTTSVSYGRMAACRVFGEGWRDGRQAGCQPRMRSFPV
jgi:hypothetical protein